MENPRRRRRYFGRRLLGLQLEKRFFGTNRITLFLEPGRDGPFADRLPHRRYLYINGHWLTHKGQETTVGLAARGRRLDFPDNVKLLFIGSVIAHRSHGMRY